MTDKIKELEEAAAITQDDIEGGPERKSVQTGARMYGMRETAQKALLVIKEQQEEIKYLKQRKSKILGKFENFTLKEYDEWNVWLVKDGEAGITIKKAQLINFLERIK